MLQLQQFLALPRQQALHRNAGPAGHHIGDVALLHLFAQDRLPLQFGLQGFAALLQAIELVVLQPGCFLIVTLALGLGDGVAQVFVLLQQLPQLRQPLPLRLPALLQRLQALGGAAALLLQLQPLLQRRRLSREQGQLHPAQLGLGSFHQLGLGGDLHAQLGGGLIHQINGRIGQAAIGDVAVGQASCRHQSLVGDGHAVVQLVALLETPQDLHTGVEAWLLDQHLLEAALQARILLDAAAIVLGGGGADAAQVTLGQGWLKHAAGIGVGAIAAHHRVQLVDKQHHACRTGHRIGVAHLLEHGPQALLKLAAKLGPSDQGAQIQGHQPQTLQRVGHLAGHDALGQQLGHGGLADAGLPNQHRVVLAAAGEHLDQAAHLQVAADHRIELASPGRCGEVPAVALQGTGLGRLLLQWWGRKWGDGQWGWARVDPGIDWGSRHLRGRRSRWGWAGAGGTRPKLALQQVFAEPLSR